MAVCYTVEPVTSQVYIRAACAAGEAVQGALRARPLPRCCSSAWTFTTATARAS